ncbi:GntR family transcriptional regulator [Streptomyces sp. NPDC047525]|uniref:GntR family transcriptional regulator n=1 Tax=Streptomyces sp. NPDC047525 TaxID=3155264 RepID=UPI0033F59819
MDERKSRTTPRYLEIAARITNLITEAQGPADIRLPSERELSEMYGAHRDTVRRALRRLREQRRIYTGKRGTFAYSLRAAPESGAGQKPDVATTARLTYERVPPDVAKVLSLGEGLQTLVLRHRAYRGTSVLVRTSTSYFSSALLTSVPQLRDRARPGRPPEPTTLRDVHAWLLDAQVRPARPTAVRASARETRAEVPDQDSDWSWQRTLVHDQHGRLMAVTDLGHRREL